MLQTSASQNEGADISRWVRNEATERYQREWDAQGAGECPETSAAGVRKARNLSLDGDTRDVSGNRGRRVRGSQRRQFRTVPGMGGGVSGRPAGELGM